MSNHGKWLKWTVAACCIVGTLGISLMLSSEPEADIRLSVEERGYLVGEPIIFRVSIDGEGMTDEQMRWLRDRTTEVVLVSKSGGPRFPALHSTNRSTAYRSITGAKANDLIILQPYSCWPEHHRSLKAPDWTEDFLQPGEYTIRVEQHLLKAGMTPEEGGLAPVRSNSVRIVITEPTGRNADAWKEIEENPVLLRLDRDRFPSSYLIRDEPYAPGDRTPEALARNIEFAKEYIDTPYGQFAAVDCAMVRGYDHKVDLYPTLGRLIELRAGQDFVTQYARYVYLMIDTMLGESFDVEKRLAVSEELLKSLRNPPAALRGELEREIASWKELIESPIAPSYDFASIEKLVQRLIDRGEWPIDPEVRERRRNIALGRMDAP